MNMNAMKTNNRLIVSVAVLFLIVAGIAVVAMAENSNATTYAEKSPLSFSGDIDYGEQYGTTSNVGMNNSITVTYDKSTGKYTFYGYLAAQDIDNTETAFYKLWEDNTDYLYGIAFKITDSSNPVVKIGSTGNSVQMTDGVEECLLYLDGQSKDSTVKIGDVSYTLDLSGIQYLSVNDLSGKQIIKGSEITAENNTIDLTSDAYMVNTITTTTGNIVVNLNGYNLMTGVRVLNADTDNTNTTVSLTINAGNGGSITAAYDIVYANSTGKLTVNGGNYTSDEYAFIWGGATVDENSTTSAEIRNATIDADVGIWLSYGTFNKAIIDNCTINADFGLYLATFNDGNDQGAIVKNTIVNAVETAVEIKSGNVTIENCNLSSQTYVATDGTIGMSQSGSGIDTVCINNGYTSSGSAVKVAVTIKDSTITNSATDMPVQVLVGNKKSGNNYVACSGNIELTSNCLDSTQVSVGYTELAVEAGNKISLNLTDGGVNTVIDESGVSENADSGNTIIVSKDITTENNVTLSGGTSLVIGDGTTYSGPVTVGPTESFSINGGTYTGLVTTTDGKDDTNAATLTNVSGNFTITYGSVGLSGDVTTDASGNITIGTGNATVIDSFTIGNGVTLTVSAGATLEIPTGAILNVENGATFDVNGTVTNNGTINNNGTIDITAEDASIVNNGNIYTSTSAGAQILGATNIKGNSPVGGLGLSTNMDAIQGDLPLSGYAFLTSDLTIPAGKSISVNGGATLDLRGYTLTVLGTLNVASSGTVIDSGASSVDGIKIGTTGVINNSGIIGSTNAPVTVSLTSGVSGSVTLANVNGLSFGYKRIVDNNTVTYYLAISGDATKRGQNNGSITVSGTVYAIDALSIGSKVDATINGTLVLDNSVELTISTSGTASGNGKVVLGVNSVVDVDGYADIVVSAKTGDYQANLGTGSLAESSIDINNVKGIEVTVTSESYSKNNALWMKQRLDISGAMDDATDATSSIGFSGAHITVTGTLTVNKDIDTWTNSGTITVTGTISYGDDVQNGVSGGILNGINGTSYSVQTTTDGQISTTNYVTSFKSAIENIANAYEQSVTIHGDVDVDFSFDLAADQMITGNGTMTIKSGAVVTVNNDASIDMATGVDVDGKLVVFVNGYVDQPIRYDVSSTDAEYTVTYSGFAVALAEAQPGQTITVQNPTYVEGDVTIPEGVTVIVSNNAVLGVGYKDADNTADNTADLTVNGTLKVMGSVNVYGDVNVAGTADIIEATGFEITSADGEITVTGILTTVGNTISNETVNAVMYTALDGNTVYTNLAAAAEAVNAFDVNKIITQVGTVSDSAAVTLTGVTLNVNGTARLGTVTLDQSSIVVGADGKLTATVAGLSGEEGYTVTTTVTLTSVEDVTVANAVVPNDANVDVHTTSIALTANAANDKLVGAVSVDAGVLAITDTIVVDGANNTLAVASGAEAVIAAGNKVTAGAGANSTASITVNGTMIVNGELDVTGVMDVAGTLDVSKAKRTDAAAVKVTYTNEDSFGVLNIAGVLNVSADQDLKGTVTVNGVLAVEGTITGAIGTIGQNGYIKAYAGSNMTGAEVLIDPATGETTSKTTVFHVNGNAYMTVYINGTNTAVTYQVVLTGEEFSVPGYDVSNLKTLWTTPAQGQPVAIWYTDVDLTQKIGTNQETADDVLVGNSDNLYAKVSALTTEVKVSVGTGISLYIDDIRITENTVTLSVGTHTVSAVVDPGYTGTVSISFNGQAVSGSFEITSDMASAAYDGVLAISASGNITQDSTVVVDGGSEDGLGLTDILLIILVVLIVVMAIMVALRLMRS